MKLITNEQTNKPKTLYKQMRLMLPMLVLALVGSVLFGHGKSYAATKTWTGGGGDANFTTAGNWGGSAPSAGDALVFPTPSGANTPVTLDASFSASSITVNGDSGSPSSYVVSLTAGSAKTLTLTGNITIGNKTGITTDSDITVSMGNGTTVNQKKDSLLQFYGPLAIGSGTVTFTTDATPTSHSELAEVFLGSGVTGSGHLIVNKSALGMNNNGGFTGSISVDSSQIDAQTADEIGGASTTVTMVNSRLSVIVASGAVTFPQEFTITGNFLGASNIEAEIGTEAIYHGGTSAEVNFTGPVTLHSDILVDPYTGPIHFSGALNGSYLFGITSVYTDASKLIVEASPNTSLIPNGTYSLLNGTVTITDSSSADILTQADTTLIVNGTRGRIILSSGSYLKGTGTVGAVNVFTNAHLAPGQSPGCLNTGSLSFSAGSHFDLDINGTTVCSGYDRTVVTGAVTLSSTYLNISLGSFSPAIGTKYTVIDNDGSDAVSGTFNGLAEGATFKVGSKIFKVSYVGGTGNDVVLSVVSSPGTPGTGFKMLRPSYIGAAVAVVTGVSMLGFARRSRQYSK